MLNLSQLARESPSYPFISKIKNTILPDIYLAESIADYKENAPNLEFPWYKRFPFPDKTMDRAYIILQNIRIKKASIDGTIIPNWFILHDNLDEELVYWNANHELFPTNASFDEVQERQGLTENDWVYDVLVRYLIQGNLPSIIQVNKYKFSNKKPERDSLAERIRSFFPEFKPEYQPIF